MSCVKVTHLVGQSRNGFAQAAEAALNEAARTIRNIKSFQVDHLSGEVVDGRIANYRASVQIAFISEQNEMAA
jgi:flavin-binding protein dodecin